MTVAAIAALIYHRFPIVPSGCDYESKNVASSQRGDTVVLDLEICGGMAFSSTATMSLMLKGRSRKRDFYVFSLGAQIPSAHWISDTELEISPADPEEVFHREDHVRDIGIYYR